MEGRKKGQRIADAPFGVVPRKSSSGSVEQRIPTGGLEISSRGRGFFHTRISNEKLEIDFKYKF